MIAAMDLITTLALLLGVSFVFGELFRLVKLPRIVGQLIAGIVIGNTALNELLMNTKVSEAVNFLSQIGVVFLLLLAGMEINLEKFKRSFSGLVWLSFSTTFTPLILGVIVGRLLGFSWVLSLILGGALAVTAEGTTITVFLYEKVLKTKLATYIIGAGIIDDLIEILLVSFVSLIIPNAKNSENLLANIPHTIAIPLLLAIAVIVFFIIVKIVPWIILSVSKEKDEVAIFSAVLLVTFLLAALSKLLSFGYAIGAFIAGVLIQTANIRNPKEEQLIEENLKVMTLGFIVPFFFINIGLHFKLEYVLNYPKLFLYVLLAGILGKILGAVLARKAVKVSFLQSTLIGWCMNARGAIELVVIEIARTAKIIPLELYSAIVAMTVVSAILFPLALRFYNKHWKGVMN